jgi:hypothetical protein
MAGSVMLFSCTLARAPAVFIERHGSSNHARLRSHSESTVCSFLGGETYENASGQARSDTHHCTFADVHCSLHDDSYCTGKRSTSCQSDNAISHREACGKSKANTCINTATRSTGSPAVQSPSRVQQKGEGAFFPVVIGTLSGIAAVVLLVAVGLFLLRKWLMPVRKVKLPPSDAAPWRVCVPRACMTTETALATVGRNSQLLMPSHPSLETLLPPERGSRRKDSCGPVGIAGKKIPGYLLRIQQASQVFLFSLDSNAPTL